MADAYSQSEEPFRTHLGASVLGDKCGRALWYGFRWAKLVKHEGRILRLFNRGHLEEARFLALMKMCGFQVWMQDANGKQFRIKDADGHLGGSCDCVVMGLPELAPDTPCLGEFKTHSDKSFSGVKTSGVFVSKPLHYVQCQSYMHHLQLPVTLYLAVNKNDDEIYAELIPYNQQAALAALERGRHVVYSPLPLPKLHDSAGWYECRYCDFKPVCHSNEVPAINCRTCKQSVPHNTGDWICKLTGEILTKEKQFVGCDSYGRLI
jgi:hypothetical protein